MAILLNKGINGCIPSFNPRHKPLKNAVIGFQYLYMTNTTAPIASAIQPIGEVKRVTENALKAIIALMILSS
ncbi:MAG: hypothetical protein ACI37Q_09240 [Candidatus Gastranaerophilaceae bacterium]